MRIFVVALVLAMAGCTGADPGPLPGPGAGPFAAQAPLPPDLDINATMPPSTNDTPMVGIGDDPPCSDPLTETCHSYPVELARHANITLLLTWAPQPNDLDLYVYRGGALVAADNRGGMYPTREFLRVLLGPGSYEVVVAGYFSTSGHDFTTDMQAVGTPYRLQAFFDEP